MKASRLSREQRQERIVQIAKNQGSMRVNTLAETFGVTAVTTCQDLGELCGHGLLHRTYGNAVVRMLTPAAFWIKRAMLERGGRSRLRFDSGKFNLHRFELIGGLRNLSDVKYHARL